MRQTLRLRIERLGRRGEGVASQDNAPVFVPFGLPGEEVLAEVEGERGWIVELIAPRPDRQAPICPHYGVCGGCAVQTLPNDAYADWKRKLVVTALDRAGLKPDVDPLVDAHGEGRRRATFHARFGPPKSPVRIGFMRARAHEIVDLDRCPVLAPAMENALAAARRIAGLLARAEKPLDLVVTATDAGLDVDLRGLGAASSGLRRSLVAAATDVDLARLSNHGDILVERRAPTLRLGEALLLLPPGAFLQATARGESLLADHVLAALGAASRVSDLFCGIGTFALRLAGRASVDAFDSDGPAVAALERAARAAPQLHPVTAHRRDLFARPVLAEELKRIEGLVFDPPRAGAAAQAVEIARSGVGTVVAVSCDAVTFARDAVILTGGGYVLERVTPIDQFRFSPHVEIVGVFRKAAAAGKSRRLLS
jgi:23S rRNA (uracil1939-C5)-methyltransferase